jgi:hypothetical protein
VAGSCEHSSEPLGSKKSNDVSSVTEQISVNEVCCMISLLCYDFVIAIKV